MKKNDFIKTKKYLNVLFFVKKNINFIFKNNIILSVFKHKLIFF